MYDQAYNQKSLEKVLHRGDFKDIPPKDWDDLRKTASAEAAKRANNFFEGKNPIKKFHLKKKPAYRIKELANDLVVRKLALNIKNATRITTKGRSFWVKNAHHFIEESVPYRIYRLDISSFYESFDIPEVKKRINSISNLIALSKQHASNLLDHYKTIGGEGLPRGMAISAVISELMMREFDAYTFGKSGVYFYGRYVDDIIIITNKQESQKQFLKDISNKLPTGLKLNNRKKRIASADPAKNVKSGATNAPVILKLEYLGYELLARDPVSKLQEGKALRRVKVEIAPSKVAKIKKRIVRSFRDFVIKPDPDLLVARVKFLTSNFSIVERRTGKKKLAGIYHSYPLLSQDAESLKDLDSFLRNAALSKKGPIFSVSAPLLTQKLKRRLLSHSFSRGHSMQRFVHFSYKTIGKIQECWKND